jgi:hypothetical protein
MFFRRFRLNAGHLKKVLPGFSTAQDSTSSLIAGRASFALRPRQRAIFASDVSRL